MPTRKELIASGVEITPLTREEILLQGGEIEPLNVIERVLQRVVRGGVTPEGTITITQNGTGIDVAQYATADVAVPASAVVSGTKSITENGTEIDVTEYASVDVSVPVGSETGSLKVTRTDNITVNIVVTALTAQSVVSATTTLIGKNSNKTVKVPMLGTFWLDISVDIIGYASRTMTVSGNTGGDVIYYKANAAYHAFVPIACPADTEISVVVSNG